jgi:arabinofuranosyltransferase
MPTAENWQLDPQGGPPDEGLSTIPRLSFRIEHVLLAGVTAVAAAYWLAVASKTTSPGFPLDDAWIHLQFARNVADGHGFSFNPGVPSSGSTAPLWTLLLAGLLAVGVPPLAAAQCLGVALTWATVILATEFTRLTTGSRGAGFFAGACVAVSGRVVWASVSGMEGPLFAFLTLATLTAYLFALADVRRTRGLWGLLAGLAGTARPEAFVIFPLLVAHWVWKGEIRRQHLRTLARPIAMFLAVAIAYVAVNYHAGGHPLPMTFYAKTDDQGVWHALVGLDVGALRSIGTAPLVSLNKMLLFYVNHSSVLFAALIVGLLALTDVFSQPRLRAGAGMAAGVWLLTPLLKGLFAPTPTILQHEGRYITHLTVLFLVAAATGLFVLHRWSKRRWVIPAIALVAFVRLAAQDMRDAEVNGRWVKNINDLQVATADWIRTHTADDAVVATNDIGAIGYFSRRSIIDTEGLVTPEAIAFKRQNNLAGLLEKSRPDLLVIFPERYPDVQGSSMLTEVHRISANRVIAAGPTLVIYSLPWTRPGRVR